jgi:hypothetical protein
VLGFSRSTCAVGSSGSGTSDLVPVIHIRQLSLSVSYYLLLMSGFNEVFISVT